MFEMNPMKPNAGRPAEARETEQRHEAATVTKLQNHERPASLAIIGSTILIKGDLSGEEGLVIQGRVEGTINLKRNSLIIGQEGKVVATIHAHTITIEGSLKGDVFGEERVVVKKTGNVHGNISAPQVSLEEGAKFKGSMDMDCKRTA
jgi:cytoskeletal protein CcmA (bactofilin family)